MNTCLLEQSGTDSCLFEPPVFMGSGLGLSGRPGMTPPGRSFNPS